ncbi:biotin-dependent carboxyltransferase family protein [Aliikangiella sp. G2MR2-5]|uniref:5-oxoprolinase subunit C family protein n=1 Tax=Aliikangiella sp. G2MR2-5 TaxID=2788943 RepID=UPI0018A8A2C8|nr:biotin-dependent carboxyltransferase family protein [Aliikangiella sp. G2MR2-5]
MSLRFIKPGLQTSLQDSGRSGFMHHGIGAGGVMDSDSASLANWLVGNPANAAVLEITLIGPVIEFLSPMTIAVCGAEFVLSLNEFPIENGESIEVEKGDILTFGHRESGSRAYLAFSAEPDVEKCFDSFSTQLSAGFGGFKGRAFQANEELALKKIRQTKTRRLPRSLVANYLGKYLFRCCPAVETEKFETSVLQKFQQSAYQVSADSNRMGVRLIGEPIDYQAIGEIISGGLTQGSIQLPSSGLPIISSVDGQTIGGYPRIANIISADLPLLGQLRANDRVRFQIVTLEKAVNFLRQKQAYYNRLLAGKLTAH